VLDEAGISGSQLRNETQKENSPKGRKENSEFLEYDDSDLAEMLHETVENEEFERASLIRDEINRRNKV
jgi:protein-arginine kinase activator protein McsA